MALAGLIEGLDDLHRRGGALQAAPRKGHLPVGTDADIALWESEREVTIRQADLHHGSDDTPYEGFYVRGWPVRTLLGGRTFMHDGEIGAEKLGQYLARSCRPWLRRRSVEHETGRACWVTRSLSTSAHDTRVWRTTTWAW